MEWYYSDIKITLTSKFTFQVNFDGKETDFSTLDETKKFIDKILRTVSHKEIDTMVEKLSTCGLSSKEIGLLVDITEQSGVDFPQLEHEFDLNYLVKKLTKLDK